MAIGDATNGEAAPVLPSDGAAEQPAVQTSVPTASADTQSGNETAGVDDPVATAAQLSAAGARFHALKKYSDATDSYSKACELLSAHFGELAPETGDALLAYGRSLLEYCRSQSSVLGMGGPGNTAAEPNQEQPAAGPSQVQPEASSSKPKAQDSRIHFSGDSSDDEAEGDAQNADEPEQQQPFNMEDELENAFNALDSARVAFSRVANGGPSDERTKEGRAKQIKALDLLGDVHAETEQFDQAIERYKEALALKELDRVANDDRVLAEAHLLIALAYDFVPNVGPAKAIEHAELAQTHMRAKLASLAALRDAGTATARDLDEIVDIEGVMGELNEKVEELKTVPQEHEQTPQERALEEYLSKMPHLRQGMGSGPSGLGDAAVVNDLNTLVKKKKAPAPATNMEPIAQPVVAVDDAAVKAAEQAALATAPIVENGNAKRKADGLDDVEVLANGSATKKLKEAA